MNHNCDIRAFSLTIDATNISHYYNNAVIRNISLLHDRDTHFLTLSTRNNQQGKIKYILLQIGTYC